jgi:hypothetical protein
LDFFATWGALSVIAICSNNILGTTTRLRELRQKTQLTGFRFGIRFRPKQTYSGL